MALKIQDIVPLMVYDNECYVCVQFAKLVNYLAKGRLYLVGHYTDFGKDLRDNFLDSSALKMFWFIDSKTAYGGRAAISPLFSAILNSSKSFPKKKIQIIPHNKEDEMIQLKKKKLLAKKIEHAIIAKEYEKLEKAKKELEWEEKLDQIERDGQAMIESAN